MSKKLPIPPIRPNPRRGKETASDASVVWGGAKLPEKSESPPERSTLKRSTRKKSRKTRQKSIHIPNEEGLKRMAEKLGMSEAAVLNLGLAYVLREFDR